MFSTNTKLLLSLFKFRIFFVYNVQFSFASNYFTVNTSFLYGCSNFHFFFFKTLNSNLFVPKSNSRFCQIIGAHL